MEYAPGRMGAGDADAGCDSSGGQRRDLVVRGGGHSANAAGDVPSTELWRLGGRRGVNAGTPEAQEFTKQYAAAGWRVIATARDPANAKEL